MRVFHLLIPALVILFTAGPRPLAQGFGPDLDLRGNASVLSEIGFKGDSGYNSMKSTLPPFLVGTGRAFAQGLGGTPDCGYDQLVEASTLGLAEYGHLAIEGAASVLNRGFSTCPTPVYSGVLSTEPGSAFSFSEPSFQDRLTFTSATLPVGTSNSVRVEISFSGGDRLERLVFRDETSATGRRTTNFVVRPSAQRTATLVTYRANGSFASQVVVEVTNPNGTYTLPVEVGGKLNVAVQLREGVEARTPRFGNVIEHHIQYSAAVSVTVDPLDPAVTFTAESRGSYHRLGAPRLTCLAATNGQLVIRVPPELKLQSARPVSGGWDWLDRAEKSLVLINPTNTVELFRAVTP